jgi:aldose 1-epimerase
LLAPWANRLGAPRYDVGGVTVDLEGLALHTDDQGLPIHGTMTAQPGWEVVEADERSFTARFAFGDQPGLSASFPFPHELRVEVAIAVTTLRVATTVTPTTDRAVPISFGYHPYLQLPGARREDIRLRLPARRHLQLDSQGLPTGVDLAEDAEDEPLGSRAFDDLYELASDRRLGLTGGGRRLTVELEDGYRFAQVFTPPAADSVCLEPMTAAVNALVDGGYPLVAPGASFTARFSLTVEDVE